MNTDAMQKRVKELPKTLQEQVDLFVQILHHAYETEQATDSNDSDIDQKKIKIINKLLQESEIDLLLNIENL